MIQPHIVGIELFSLVLATRYRRRLVALAGKRILVTRKWKQFHGNSNS